MQPTSLLGGQWRAAILALSCLMVAGILWYALSTTGTPSGAQVDVAYYLAMASASALCMIRAVKVPAQRTAWIFLSGVLVFDLVGDLSWTYYQPFSNFADGVWLLSYLWMFGAVVCLVLPLAGRWNLLLTLDWLIATLTVSAIAVLMVLPPIVDALPSTSLDALVTVAYPIGDIIVLASLAIAVVVGIGRPSVALGLIVLAGAVWAVGDAVYSYQEAKGIYEQGGILDLVWPLAVALIAAAAWAPSSTGMPIHTASRRAGWLSGLCIFVSLLIIVPPNWVNDYALAFYLALSALGLGAVRLVLTQHENRRLLSAANTDPLTGIGSRAKLSVDAVNLEGRAVTVAVVDLDGFKFYNDSFGHPAGDVLLRRITVRLSEALGQRGEIYRIGGDEFCALIPGHDPKNQISRDLRAATHLVGDGFEITASIGTASYPYESADLDAAISLADERMYLDKNTSRTSARSQVHEVLVRSIREREPELATHTLRVRELALRVGRRMSQSSEELDVIERAAELHDVGKVAIPDSILYKPGPLTDDEWQLMRQHTIVVERIISASPALAPVAKLVRSSHERWDGCGYPDGLSGEDIPLGARIILACDTVEAMTAERTYAPSSSIEEVVAEIRRGSGTQFDPRVAEALISILEADGIESLPEPDSPAGLDKWSE